jgi:hypothetical protein
MAQSRFCSKPATAGAGMFVELGGEFVDNNHEDLHTLAKEVGVEMQDLTTEGGEELYFFKGQFHTPKDMVDPEKKSGRADCQTDR